MARCVAALALITCTIAILVFNHWPAEAPAAVASTGADLANLPVMYD
ncbi:MAG: hypothetical protein HYU58_03965 [Proteobacteria bacterium]|nr:hypothetical protein [Pseudomonadota bacterium]